MGNTFEFKNKKKLQKFISWEIRLKLMFDQKIYKYKKEDTEALAVF